MSDEVDEKWLAEQSQAAGNEIIDTYGWVVPVEGTEDGMNQETVVRMLVAAGYSDGYKAGLKARHDA